MEARVGFSMAMQGRTSSAETRRTRCSDYARAAPDKLTTTSLSLQPNVVALRHGPAPPSV